MNPRELIRNRGLLGLLARDVVSLTGSQMRSARHCRGSC